MIIMKQLFNQNVKKMRKMLKCVNFIKIDLSFVFMFVLAIILDEVWLYVLFVVFICLHELVHFFVAKKLGYMASKIHLTFFGASLEGLDDFSIFDEVKIILAGPLFNLLVVIFCYLCFWFYPESYHYLHDVLLVNWAIFLFNFLPVFPLDLGRILLAVFSRKWMRKDALNKTKFISLLFIFFMFCLYLISFFFTFNFSLGFVCVNLLILCLSSSKGTSFSRSIFVKRKFKLLSKGLIERTIYVKSGLAGERLFKYVDDYHFANFIFLDENLNYVGEINEIDLYKSLGLF